MNLLSQNTLLRRISLLTLFVKVNCILFFGAILLVSYNELLCYKIKAQNWRTFPYNSDSVKMLFVADPQLIGLNNEPWWMGFISRWDSDRYLSKGFTEALNHIQPDAVVFLGDLFDEGSSSTDLQFESYVRRFNTIFRLPPHVKKFFILGDNDIAREGSTNIEQNIKERFDKYFPTLSKSLVSVGFLDILKFEPYQLKISEDDLKLQIVNNSRGRFKIFCNHFGSFNILRKVMKTFKPNVILFGHEHKSAVVTCQNCQNTMILSKDHLGQDDDFLTLNFSGNVDTRIIGIEVPTCSYRMGVPKMGYGFMTLDYSGQMNYTVLWLPGRFSILYSYIWFCCLLFIVMCMRIFKKFVNSIGRSFQIIN